MIKINLTTKSQTLWISLLQGVILILELIYLQPLLLRTSIESYVDINQPPITFGVIVAILLQLLIIAGYPGYLIVKHRAWKPALAIFFLTILWITIFFLLLLFS